MADRDRVRVVFMALAVSVACSPGIIGRVAAQAAAEQRPSGIYPEAPAGGPTTELRRLSGNMPRIDAAGVGLGTALGFGKPKMTTTVDGDKASVRVAPAGTFLFVFGEPRSPREMMSDPAAGLSMLDELPAHTSNPKGYALIRLAVKEGDRVYSSKNGEQVKCSIEKLGSKVFRIRPEQALPPGEYAFTLMSSGVAGMMWDFGVDAATLP